MAVNALSPVYIACVTFAASEGGASTVASGHSNSRRRLETFLARRMTEHAARRAVCGTYYTYIEVLENGKLRTLADWQSDGPGS